MMNDITFRNSEFFCLLVLVPVFIVWHWWKYREQYVEMKVSSAKGLSAVIPSLRIRLRPLLFILRLLAFVFIVTALARPQSKLKEKKVTTEGIDIVLTMDISSSMLAEDFKPNRIEAAKKVAAEFISNRPNDRVGMVVFAGESFTQCPITTDHRVLKNMMKGIKSGLIEDGTAIGMGLATAVNRLRESKMKSKVIILLTDGVNNAGFIDPLTAAEAAIQYNIRVYTIGVGTKGMAPYPIQTIFGKQYQNIEVRIDEQLLKEIARQTNGKYFRATSNNKLKKIYEEIDRLEKSKIEVTSFMRYSEEFLAFALIGSLLFFIEIFLKYTIFRSSS